MNTKTRSSLVAVGGIFVLFAAYGCGREIANQAPSKPHYEKRGPVRIAKTFKGTYPIKVVCTTGMVADLVRHVGGVPEVGEKYVKVIQLMKHGTDPHLYEPPPSDIALLQSADLIFYSGLHLEGKMGEILDSFSRRKPVFAVAEYYDEKELIITGQGMDPHAWFDVELWNKARGVVENVLNRFDPMHADTYHDWSMTYKRRLEDLHKIDVKEYIETHLPDRDRRILVTAHDAFSYFGKKYGFTVKGIQGISTESQATVRHVQELVDYLVKHKVKAVFVETSVNERNMKSLIEGCAAQGHTVKIGGKLFSDAMGELGTVEGTYVGMVRHNVESIVEALK